MLALKQQKKLLLAGTARFNIKPKTGLAFLEEKGLISTAKDSIGASPSRNRSLARFLKKSPRLDKKLLGEYISRPENAEVLKEFINLYDFDDVSELSIAACTTEACFFEQEIRCRGTSRTLGVFPPPGRGAADRTHYLNVRRVLFRS
jgi:hypothetical protein